MSIINLNTGGYAPGTYVTATAAPAPSGDPSSTGNLFMAGLSLRGPVGTPITLNSLNDFLTLCGQRATYNTYAYDSAEVFFATGGQTIYFSRVVGPAATPASFTLKDRAGTPQNTLVVTSNGPGVDGNNLSVAVIAGSIAGSYAIQVSYAGTVVETSPPLLAVSDAVNWGTLSPASPATLASKYVTITNAGSTTAAPNNIPALVAATSLVGGADDNSNAGDTQYTAALTAFPINLGPGQVAAPGRTTAAVYTALLNHAQANNRFALLDAGFQAATSAVTSAAAGANQSAVDPSYGTMLDQWVLWPGIPTGSPVPAWPRQIPPSALAAGLMAANDAATGTCNQAAAGVNGQSALALGVAGPLRASTDLAALNAAGVSVFKQIRSAGNLVELYGYVTLSQDPRWTDMANARFRMQLVDEAHRIGESFFGSQIDGAGHTVSAFSGALTAMLTAHYNQNSLYGATPAQAFQVDTASCNTALTASNRQLNAILGVRMSPSAEFVDINIVKFLATQQVAV